MLRGTIDRLANVTKETKNGSMDGDTGCFGREARNIVSNSAGDAF